MIANQVINYLLDTKDSSIIVQNDLTAKYFPNYENEFNFILDHFQKYGNIPDKATFLSAFPNFDLVQVAETPRYLVEELFRQYSRNEMAKGFNEMRTLILNDETEKAEEVFEKTYEEVRSRVVVNCTDILKDTSRYDAYEERTRDFDKYYVRTGFPHLDSIIGGWDREEELAVIVARTNQGKSYVALKMALEAAEQGLKVGFYSGEMTERKVGYRLDTLLGHIPNGALIHGSETIKDDYKAYMDQLPSRIRGSILVLTPKSLGCSAGVNALRAFIEKEKLDILFVDQYSLLDDDHKARTPFERISNISKDLKNLQVMERIPIIAVSQQNRTKNEDAPDVIDTNQIALSDRIGQDATIIIGITRDKAHPELMTLQVVKSRDSVVGSKITYKVDFNTGVFQEEWNGEEEDDAEPSGSYGGYDGEEVFS